VITPTTAVAAAPGYVALDPSAVPAGDCWTSRYLDGFVNYSTY